MGLSHCRWDGQAGEVALEGLAGLRSWAQLLAALRPPAGDAPLRVLRIERCDLPAEAVDGCPPLPDLTELFLDRCTGGAGGGDGQPAAPLGAAAAGALLHAAPRLEALAIRSCLHGELPAALAAMRGLTLLDLTSNKLTDLPPGDWLAGAAAAGGAPAPCPACRCCVAPCGHGTQHRAAAAHAVPAIIQGAPVHLPPTASCRPTRRCLTPHSHAPAALPHIHMQT